MHSLAIPMKYFLKENKLTRDLDGLVTYMVNNSFCSRTLYLLLYNDI